MTETKTRKSMFAGRFYPGRADEIKLALDLLKEKAGVREQTKRPAILILPHAAWQFSGLAAVRGIMTLVPSPPSRVVLIGPSHRTHFLGFSPAGFEKYVTPLGELVVDLTLQEEIIDQTGFKFEPEAHKQEHSLEVILPMLQYLLPGERKILPILGGSVSRASTKMLADSLSGALDPFSDVLIVSSDLSHFHPYEKARELDKETINVIIEGDIDPLLGYAGDGGRKACGYCGIVVAIELARKWGLEKPELLMYYNSGDSGGPRDEVVGYASIAWPLPNLGAV